MAIPINIEDLLNRRKIESNRIEFKKGWNPTDIYRTIGAFANDFDNLGGGYVIVGVEEEHGVAKRPVAGINAESIDGILQQMIGFNNLIEPHYMPRTSAEEVDGRLILVIWIPSGVDRPYAVPSDVLAKEKKHTFFIRIGTSSIVAKGEILDELRDLANRVPFDERPNPNIKMSDISMALLRDYLAQTGSRLEPQLFSQPLEQTLEQMDLMDGPDRTISKSDIEIGNKMISRRYRNRRLGDFLKELGLTEGRSTGIPTIQEELVKNGSPRAVIETNEERSFINVFIPIHEGCGDIVVLNDTKDVTKDVTKELSERQIHIVNLIDRNPTITIPEMSLKLAVTTRTIKRDLALLIDSGLLKREGGRKEGRWIICIQNTNT